MYFYSKDEIPFIFKNIVYAVNKQDDQKEKSIIIIELSSNSNYHQNIRVINYC